MKNISFILVLVLFSCSSQKNIKGKYICAFCPYGDKTHEIYLDENGCGEIITTIHKPPRYIDTIYWVKINNLILINEVNPIIYEWEDSMNCMIFPKKLLYSNGYLVSYQDSTVVLYYKVDKNTGYKDDFYYWEMITSGKQDSIITVNFGDSLKIIKTLTQ